MRAPSAADVNRFYARYGFVLVEQGEVDNYYVRTGTKSLSWTRCPRRNYQQMHLQTERLDGGLYTQLGWIATERMTNKTLDVVMTKELPQARSS